MSEKYQWKLNPTFTAILKKCVEVNVTPALYGLAGIGKSCVLKDLAKQLGTQCFSVTCNQLAGREDVTQPRIVKTTDKNGSEDFKSIFVVIDRIKEAAEYAATHTRETPILFLDEYNRVPADLTTGLMSLITERRAGSVEFPPNLRIVIAGNAVGNVASDDDAVVTRLVNFFVEPDVTTWFNAPGINSVLNPSIKDVIMANNDLLLCKPKSDDDLDYGDEVSQAEQYTCPRTLEYLSMFLNKCDQHELDNWESQGILLHLIQSFIGATDAANAIHADILKKLSENQVSSGQTATLVKPAIYEDLKKLGTIDEIADTMSALSLKERASIIAYALFEKEDNTNIILAQPESTPFPWEDPECSDIATAMFTFAKEGNSPDVENIKKYLARTKDQYINILANVSNVF